MPPMVDQQHRDVFVLQVGVADFELHIYLQSGLANRALSF